MSESTMTIDKRGNKFWRNSLDQFHRIDGPAIERSDGSKEWWQNGLLCRIDGPAIQWSNGTKVWYKKGLTHRIDGPAIEWAANRKVSWYIKGKFLGNNLEGFWKFWERLNEEERQNVNLHIWLARLQNV